MGLQEFSDAATRFDAAAQKVVEDRFLNGLAGVLNPDGMVNGQRGQLHPALHFDPHGAAVGVVTETGAYRLCTSAPRIHSLEAVKDELLFSPRPYPDLVGRWADTDVAQFVGGGTVPSFSEVLTLAIKVLRDAMEFPRPEQAVFVATWAVGTYFFPLFLTFPRLNLSGERESGKSKLLTLLLGLAFNALLMVTPTPAVLFRLIHEFRATILLDEVEGLDKEDAREILAIINSGYKAGGTVARCEGEKKKRVESFNVYAPLALAAIKTVNATTEDRCIPLTLQRGSDRARINAEIDLRAPIFGQIRSGCYGLLLIHWREVEDAYRQVDFPDWLNGRARELWRPLFALGSLADQENGLALTPDLLALAKEHVDSRTLVSAEGEALLHVLVDRLGAAASVTVHPGDLTEALRTRLGWQHAPSPELVASWLRRFRFPRGTPSRDREGVRYEVTVERLTDVQVRYGPPEPTHLHLHHSTR